MKKKTTKVETLEEFLARGGKVTTHPIPDRVYENHTIKVNTQFSQHQLSLGDGEFYFGESKARLKTKNKKSKKDFKSALETSKLPQHILDNIKKSIAEKKNEQ